MVVVREIDLLSLGLLLPSSTVGMVMMQPFLNLSGTEPYCCIQEKRQYQLSAIEQTLKVARLSDHGADVTHFTIIPEYSIPGIEGVKLIDRELESQEWPNCTVVIGGTDALSKGDYSSICAADRTIVDNDNNGPDKVRMDEWVNCCITWVKTASGEVRKWLQPKIAPAKPEYMTEHQSMFCGRSIFLFRCGFDNTAACRFFSLVCFDWMGRSGGGTVLTGILEQLNTQAIEALSLNWVFVIQHNDKPSDLVFLDGAKDFFINRNEFPKVHRDDAAVVFANTAGKGKPGRAEEYGASGLIFSPNASSLRIGGKCHFT